MPDISDIVEFDVLEDRLTTMFLVTLEHSPTILKAFFKDVNFDLTLGNRIEEIEFGSQVREVSSIPDARIEGESFLVYIEIKLGDTVDSSQIERHYMGGKGRKPEFCVLCITSGLDKPTGVTDAEKKLKEKGETPNIRWTNWKMVYNLLRSYEKRVKDEKSRFLIRSLETTLEKQGLVGFTGFEKGEFSVVIDFIERYAKLLKKCNQLMDEVTEKLKKSSVERLGSYRNGHSRELDLVTYAEYYFNKDDRKPASADQWDDGSVVIIEFKFQDATVQAGVMVNGKTIYEEKAEWKDFLESFPSSCIDYKIMGEAWTEAESKKDFLSKMEETRDDKTLERVHIYCPVESGWLEKPRASEEVADFISRSLECLRQHKLFKLQVAQR